MLIPDEFQASEWSDAWCVVITASGVPGGRIAFWDTEVSGIV